MAGIKIKPLFIQIQYQLSQLGLQQGILAQQMYRNSVNQAANALRQQNHQTYLSLNMLGHTIRGVGNSITNHLTRPLMGFLSESSKAAAEFEQTQVIFSVMLGSGEKAVNLMNQLRQLAAVSPLTYTGAMHLGKQLALMKTPLEEIVPTIRTIGEASGGTGVLMKRILKQWGDVRYKRVADLRDIKPMAEANVPIYDALSKVLNMENSPDAVSKKMVTFPVLVAAMKEAQKMRPDLWKKMADTYAGDLDKLNSATEELKITVGLLWNRALRPLVQVLTSFLNGLNKVLDATPTWVKYLALVSLLVVAAIGPIVTLIGNLILMGASILFLSTNMGPLTKGIALLTKGVTSLKIALFGANMTAKSFLITMLRVVLPAVLAALLLEDIYHWIKGNDSMMGVLLGNWGKWFENFVRFLEDIYNGLRATFMLMSNPFSLTNWKNYFDEVSHRVKTLGYLTGADKWGPNVANAAAGVANAAAGVAAGAGKSVAGAAASAGKSVAGAAAGAGESAAFLWDYAKPGMFDNPMFSQPSVTSNVTLVLPPTFTTDQADLLRAPVVRIIDEALNRKLNFAVKGAGR